MSLEGPIAAQVLRLVQEYERERLHATEAGGTVQARNLQEPTMTTTRAEAGKVAGEIRVALDDWREHMESRQRNDKYIVQAIRAIEDGVRARGWESPEAMTAREIDAWISALPHSGTTKNRHLGYFSSFLGWCWKTERVRENFARRVIRAQEFREGGNRAFSAEEARKLIEHARADAESESPRFKAVDRWKMYLTAWHTGLRRREPMTLQVREVRLHDEPPRIMLRPRTAKARKEQLIPLHPELVPILKTCIADKQPTDLVFMYLRGENVMEDITNAGIVRKIDGRTTGLHSLRKGMATELALKNVDEATAQKLLRHSDPRLTRNVYTDARLLPLAESVARVAGLLGPDAGLGTSSKISVKSLDAEADFADTGGAEVETPMTTTPTHSEKNTPGRTAVCGVTASHGAGPQQSPTTQTAVGLGVSNLPPISRSAGPSMPETGIEPASARPALLKPVANPETPEQPASTQSGAVHTGEGSPETRTSTGASSPRASKSTVTPQAVPDRVSGISSNPPSDDVGAMGAPSSYCDVEQRSARWAHNPEVGGSNPPVATSSDETDRLAAVDALTEAVRSHQRSSPSMRVKIAAAIGLAATLLAAGPVSRAIDNGWKCAQANGCLGQPTVSKCILCCFSWCSATTQQENECQQACLGAPEPVAGSTFLVREMASVREKLDSGNATREEWVDASGLMVALAGSPDDHVATAAVAMSDGLPWEGEAAKAFAARPPHNEQGQKTTGTRKRTA